MMLAELVLTAGLLGLVAAGGMAGLLASARWQRVLLLQQQAADAVALQRIAAARSTTPPTAGPAGLETTPPAGTIAGCRVRVDDGSGLPQQAEISAACANGPTVSGWAVWNPSPPSP